LPPDPIHNSREGKFVAIHRAADEFMSGSAFDLDVETVAAQEDVGLSECNKKGSCGILAAGPPS